MIIDTWSDAYFRYTRVFFFIVYVCTYQCHDGEPTDGTSTVVSERGFE